MMNMIQQVLAALAFIAAPHEIAVDADPNAMVAVGNILAKDRLDDLYPDVEWNKAPIAVCAPPEKIEEWAGYTEQTGDVLYGAIDLMTWDIHIKCDEPFPYSWIESTIFHELIHWKQLIETYGTTVTEPYDGYHGWGIALETVDRIGCYGAVEGEAWAAEIKEYPEVYTDLDPAVIEKIYFMLDCAPGFEEEATPFD